jgi:hypothetical protein
MKRAMKLAEALEVIRSHGRGKDTELAHVMPREKALLKALGGKGTRNPKTGLLEFEVDGGGGGDGGGNDFGGGEGGQAGDFGGGYGDFGSANERDMVGFDQSAPSVPGDMMSGSDITREALPAPSYNDEVDRIMSELAPQAPVETPPSFNAMGPEELGMPGFGAIPASPPPQPGFGEQVSNALGGFFNSVNAVPPVYTTPGMMYRGAEAIGNALASTFGPGTAPAIDYSYSTGPEGLNELATSFAAPAPVAAPQYFAPTVGAIPAEISTFIGPGMTNLQQRAAIGTLGTQGVNSAFRTDPVRRYYASLLAQELVPNRNQLNEAAYLLPVEQQYLSGIIGRPATTPAQAYESIRGLL